MCELRGIHSGEGTSAAQPPMPPLIIIKSFNPRTKSHESLIATKTDFKEANHHLLDLSVFKHNLCFGMVSAAWIHKASTY